jgi:hypothetical protein
LLALHVAACATGQATSGTGPVAAACNVEDCFFERDVREFTIVDRDTVVVYVGGQRCPFVVELQDVTCDVTFSPAIAFFQTALGSLDRVTSLQSGRVCATTRGLVLYSGIASPSLLQQQDAAEAGAGVLRRPGGLGGSDSVFGRSFPVDPLSGDLCRVGDVRSVTDDQLIELLAEVNAPPPPVGQGQLEVPEGEVPEREEGPEEGADAAAGEPIPDEDD